MDQPELLGSSLKAMMRKVVVIPIQTAAKMALLTGRQFR